MPLMPDFSNFIQVKADDLTRFEEGKPDDRNMYALPYLCCLAAGLLRIRTAPKSILIPT